MHSTFLHVTRLLLVNYEIGQSIMRTYTDLWTSFVLAKFTYSCVAFFAILRESSKRLAILHAIYMWLNGYFMSSAATVLVVVCRHPLPHHHRRHGLLSSSSVIVCCHCRLPPPSSSAVAVHRHPLPTLSVICHVNVYVNFSLNIAKKPHNFTWIFTESRFYSDELTMWRDDRVMRWLWGLPEK